MASKALSGVFLLLLFNYAISNAQDVKNLEKLPLTKTGPRVIRTANDSSTSTEISVKRPETKIGDNGTTSDNPIAFKIHKFFGEKAREDAYQLTEAEDNPYSLSYLVYNKDEVVSICSGTLVTPSWVVSAAHCIMDTPMQSVKVFAGVAYNVLLSKKPPKHAQVRVSYEFFAHPKYDPDDTDWDVAMIKVNPPFRSTKYVRPIPLTASPWNHDGYITCKLTAFGRVHDQMNSPDDYIRKTQWLQVKKPCDCQSYLTTQMNAGKLSRNVCAKPAADFGTCAGDSGGGLVCEGELKAVVSFSLPIQDLSQCRLGGPSGSGECGEKDMFDFWQDLYPSLNWINKNAFQVNATDDIGAKDTANRVTTVSTSLCIFIALLNILKDLLSL